MTEGLTPAAVLATSASAGLPLPPESAERIATALSPAFRGFSTIAGTLPLDLEPASFQVVQLQEGQK